MKGIVRAAAKQLGLEIRRLSDAAPGDPTAKQLAWLHGIREKLDLDPNQLTFIDFCACHFARSRSQLFQDLLVLWLLFEKSGGYFVEFGASDGKTLSNTYMLEKDYGWDGILAEPARGWHQELSANRSAKICNDCVWSSSGANLLFHEADWREVSTLRSFVGSDMHAQARRSGESYEVATISLNDLLEKFRAPRSIDYLSVDTEGSEFQILESLDFGAWRFSVISVEHNFTANRQRIYSLLTSNGYRRVFETISQFDDWYVHETTRSRI